MISSAATLASEYTSAIEALRALPTDIAVLRQMSESELLELISLHSQAARLLGAAGAAIAGEITFRSRPELGSQGLATRSGHRTPDNLLKHTTGATKHDVQTAIAAGKLLVEVANDGKVDAATGEVFTSTQPWMRPVARAVASGSVSTSASKSIGRGLGIADSVTPEQLEIAAAKLVAQAIAGVDADQLFLNARALRDELDLDGVKLREEAYRGLRGLSHYRTDFGGRAIMDMDVENYAMFVAAYDRMVSPKLGGVRFVDLIKAAQADSIRDDERTPKQLALDGFMQLLMAGANADDSMMLGSGAPVIHITVAEAALETGVGLARIDGQPLPISLDTVKRMLCNGVRTTVSIDAFGNIKEPLDGDHRLFTNRQGDAMAVKFGGCMDPDCDRPPSWCERHHILQWLRDGGRTVLENGILLCKHHHRKYHRDGIEIIRDPDGYYWKILPPDESGNYPTPIHMPFRPRISRTCTPQPSASPTPCGAGMCKPRPEV